MGEPCHNYWYSDMGIQDDDIFNQRYKINTSLIVDKDHIIREIMDHHDYHHQPAFSSESDNSHSPTNNNRSGGSGNTRGFVFNNNNQHAPLLLDMKASTSTSSPRSYILSFHDSTVIATTAAAAATPPPPPSLETYNNNGKRPYQHIEVPLENQAKKVRSSSETLDHIMTERKRRRELTERFIALSATIPGLKKIDKSTILSEAISHVKQLKQRVKELEEQRKKISVESVSFIIRKSHLINGTTNNKVDDEGAINNKAATSEIALLPTVEARVFKNDVLIRIHCMKQSGIMLKILGHLKSFDLSAISNSVLPFGNSTLDITIIAQIGDKFNVTMNDLVKNLRLSILESPNDDEEPHNSY
ncbi:transcription factor bHLH18-like isoform X2 [Arachis ipaensis]|uniref:transcription factor bHLH18-like isoform X2 n=1 Tax=Arachis ipaensis TaxID=130454 RepID=UPI000A2B93D0|nr:transcription factor bHLH18-like isoform X2 [Arachis ipaensis]